MATPCVLWCLVLVDLILISSGTELVQTSPSYTPLCPGDRLVLTCTTTTGAAFWKIPGHDNQAEEILGPTTIEGLMLNVTNKDGNTVTSAGIYESISVSLNGSQVSCAGENSIIDPQFVTITINITDPPVAVTDISINPINDSSIFITWLYQQNIQCIVNYTVMINVGNVSSQYSSIGSNITLTSLIIGTNYSFNIIPIDTIGREGPPSSLIQYIWNVPAQVVNISWYQISSDSVTIWWNNTENSEQRPPTQNYIFNVFNAPNSYNTTYTFTLDYTNVTIGDLLTDTNYTVTIIPGNAIGYGPSVTVNVSVSSMMSSSLSVFPVSIQASSISTVTGTSSVTELTATKSVTTSSEIGYCSCTCIATMISESTDAGTISVAIAVPITGLLTGLITAVITSIICLIMRKKGRTTSSKETDLCGPVYDLPVVDNKQSEEKPIDVQRNTAYGQAF